MQKRQRKRSASRVKTDECKDLRLFPAVVRLSQNKALTSNADAMQSCSPAFYLLLFYGPLELSVSGHKSDLIPAIASQTALSILGLTETWIRPEGSATPMHSLTTSPSLIPHQVRKGGGTGLLISKITNTQLIIPYAIITHWNLMLLL